MTIDGEIWIEGNEVEFRGPDPDGYRALVIRSGNTLSFTINLIHAVYTIPDDVFEHELNRRGLQLAEVARRAVRILSDDESAGEKSR